MSDAGPHTLREDHFALIEDVTASITASLDLEETLEAIVRRTAQALDVYECTLYEYAPESDTLVAAAVWGPDLPPEEFDWVGTVLRLADHPHYRPIVRDGAIVEFRRDDPDLPPEERAQMDEWGETATVSVPLAFQGAVIGCFDLVSRQEGRRFDVEEKELLRRLAVPAAIALHNARTFRRAEEQNRYLSSLLDSSGVINATVDLDEVLLRVAREACEAMTSSQAAVYLYDARTDAIVYQTLYERPPTQGPDEPLGDAYPLAEYPGERPILFSPTIVVEHASDPDLPPDRRESVDTWGERTVLSVPLRYQDEALGILRLYEFERERSFTALELGFLAGLGELAGAAIHNARAYAREQARGLELETLLEASQAMASRLDIEDVLDQLARRTAFALSAPQCLIYELGEERDATVLRAAFSAPGVDDDGDDPIGTEYALAEYPADRAILEGGKAVEQRLSDPGLDAGARAEMVAWGEKARLLVPIVFRDRPLGFIELLELEHERHYSEQEIQLARALAGQAAAALNNARLYRRSRDYAARLENSYLQTVTALAAAMEAKDHYTAEHADILATMAVSVGRRLGLSEPELRDLQFASVLHDIGKIGVPGHILNKPDRLTEEEFAVMAQHTVIGERIISRIEYLSPIGRIVRAAHERWDGNGYPDAVAGEQIPRAARILFVCDAFHAMTSDRPYRAALPHEDALEELQRSAGTQFDPEVIDAFLEVWPHFEDSEVAPRTPSLN